MSNQILSLLRNEISKAVRTKLPYFSIIAAGLVCLLAYAVAGDAQGDTLNAWGYVSLSMQMVFTDIGLIFIAVFAAMTIAEETGFGTARTVLSTPVLRWEFYLAKFLIAWLFSMVMSLVSLAISMILARRLFAFGAISDAMGPIYTQKDVLLNFILAVLLSWIPLAAVVTFGMLISTLVRKPGQAVAVTIGSLYVIDFTKHIIGIDAYIFTRYMGFSWLVLDQMTQGVEYQWFPELWRMLGMTITSGIVAFVAGLLVFMRRDLK